MKMNNLKKAYIKSQSTKGFTLVEVLVAISILVSITAISWLAISQIFSAREYFEQRNERTQIVRNSMNRITKDFAGAYLAGPQHGGEDLPGEERDPTTLSDEELRRLAIVEPVQFGMIGDDRKVSFTTFAHGRTQFDEQSSYHAEIGYEVRSHRDDDTGDLTQELVRREDTTLDDRLDRGGTIFTLIPNIEEFKLEYWDSGQVKVGTQEEIAEGRWVTDWDTTRNEFAGRLPQRIRITFTLPPITEDDDPEVFTTQVQIAITEVLEF